MVKNIVVFVRSKFLIIGFICLVPIIIALLSKDKPKEVKTLITTEEITPEEFFGPKKVIKKKLIKSKDFFSEVITKEVKKGDFNKKVYSPKVVVINYDVKEKITDITIQNKNEDKSFEGISKIKTTYPVDLSRVISAFRFIPAILYTEINSELGSHKVIAVIENNIFADHGKKILIPKGSKAIGGYEPLTKFGQTRINIKWQRILTPDGIHINLNSLAHSADYEGSSGLTGKIDNKNYEKYSSAMAFATLNAAAQMGLELDSSSNQAINSFSESLSSLVSESIKQSVDIAPVLHIKKGSRIIISPLFDIWFKEAQGNKIIVEAK